DVEMDEVEVPPAANDFLQHHEVVGQLIHAVRVGPQGATAAGDQSGPGDGIAAGEQGDLVPSADQCLGEIGHHPFSTAVVVWRHALEEWRHLCDPHGFSLLLQPDIAGYFTPAFMRSATGAPGEGAVKGVRIVST